MNAVWKKVPTVAVVGVVLNRANEVWAATARPSAVLAQASAPTPTKSGGDYVIPAIVVVLLIGVAVFAVCRSSNRV